MGDKDGQDTSPLQIDPKWYVWDLASVGSPVAEQI